MKDVIIYDEETGIRLCYTWDDKTGYSFTVTGYGSVEAMRKALKIAKKHWPQVPEHLKEQIDKHNEELREACRHIAWDGD